MKSFPCLTVLQPYASLIVTPDDAVPEWVALTGGPKRVENRTWPTRIRGWILIHAGKSTTYLERPEPGDDEDESTIVAAHDALPLGVVVGAARLVECLRSDDIKAGRFDEARFPWLRSHYHVNGPWCFVFDAVRPCPKPFAVRGQQGFFRVEVPDEVAP